MVSLCFRPLAVVALLGTSLGQSVDQGNVDRCPCIAKHHDYDWIADELQGHDLYGINCSNHSAHGFALTSGCDQVTESPWCKSRWCYIDPKNCSLQWDYGIVWPYSYATCRNLRNGTAQFFRESMATFLRDDVLRIVHLENTLKDGHMGNTECAESKDGYAKNQRCKGVIAEFWNRSLARLNESNVNIRHDMVIKKGNEAHPYFKDLKEAFEKYRTSYPEKWLDTNGLARPITSFDLCAFATGLGYLDLCTGSFALTHERQSMTYMIELFTAPVLLVSKSKCDFFASNDKQSLKFWFWWIDIFSPEAWAFFVAVVFLCIVVMYCLDTWFDRDSSFTVVWNWVNVLKIIRQDGCKGLPKLLAALTAAVFAFGDYIFVEFALGTFEAFVFKSKTTPSRRRGPKQSRPSYMLRLGLNFFILLTTTIYGSSITAALILAKEKKGEVTNLEAAKAANASQNPVLLCAHETLRESMKLYDPEGKINTTYVTDSEHVLNGLNNGTCNASLMEEEVWTAFLSRGELCNYYVEPTPAFYIPVGSVVSKRAYQTLETFRFDPREAVSFQNKSKVPKDSCATGSAAAFCDNKDGVPWFSFVALSLVVVFCGVLGFFLQGVDMFMGADEREKQKESKSLSPDEMAGKIERLLNGMDQIRSMIKDQSLPDLEQGDLERRYGNEYGSEESTATGGSEKNQLQECLPAREGSTNLISSLWCSDVFVFFSCIDAWHRCMVDSTGVSL